MNLLAKAIKIAAEAFEDKTDKGGNPYILHCLYVMNKVAYLGEEAMIVGVLHDLLEDIEYKTIALYENGFSHKIVECLCILWHKDTQSYDDYIKGIANSGHKEICIAVKKADLEHNSNITRLKGLTKKDFDRLEKYCRSYEYLKSI